MKEKEDEGAMVDGGVQSAISLTPPMCVEKEMSTHHSTAERSAQIVEGGVCVYKKSEEGVMVMYWDG